MSTRPARLWAYAASALAALVLAAPLHGDLNPEALVYKLPPQITWTGNPNGAAQQAVLKGDPDKPGLYIVLIKYAPHHMGRPHMHPNDRFITVLSGTWWVGTGEKLDPDATVPMPTGSFVTHYANHYHYDGAKDQEVLLQIVGMGPATSTQAGAK